VPVAAPRALRVVSALIALTATQTRAHAVSAPIIVRDRPEEIQDLLANPHMGWETFHTPADQDKSLPGWLPSTVLYLRCGWRDIEPRPGALDTARIDAALASARRAGQRLAFRIMCCSSDPGQPYQPAWLREVGGRIASTRYDETPLEVPDLDDPVTLERHLDLIRRVAARYDGRPELDHVDLGSVGWWGEWHMSGGGPVPMPRAETCRRIVDAYLHGFRKTPLLMLIGGGEQTARACAAGAGWRADCLGDLGGFGATWCHMRKGYPQWFRESRLAAVWRRAPIAYETCWDMRRWVREGWSLRYIFNYALATHASYVNNKSAPIPPGDEVRRELERFVRRLGYRFVLREASHPDRAVAGSALRIESRWQNVGSAPCYQPYRLVWRLRSARRTLLIPTATTTAGWMPGEVEVFTPAFIASPPDLPPGPIVVARTDARLPHDLPPGRYELAVALTDPSTGTPALRLAIAGRGADGWYPVGAVHLLATGTGASATAP